MGKLHRESVEDYLTRLEDEAFQLYIKEAKEAWSSGAVPKTLKAMLHRKQTPGRSARQLYIQLSREDWFAGRVDRDHYRRIAQGEKA